MQACQLGIRDVGQTGPVAGLVEPYLGLIRLDSLIESLRLSQTQFSQPKILQANALLGLTAAEGVASDEHN